MRLLLIASALVSMFALGCAKEESKPITSEAEMRKATDEMVKRQMGQMGQPMPGAAGSASAPADAGSSK